MLLSGSAHLACSRLHRHAAPRVGSVGTGRLRAPPPRSASSRIRSVDGSSLGEELDWSALGFGGSAPTTSSSSPSTSAPESKAAPDDVASEPSSSDAYAYAPRGSSGGGVPASSHGGWQRELTSAERKAKRSEAQKMGRDITLINLGRNGITNNFVAGLAGALARQEMVKVRLSSGCPLDVDEASDVITEAADCVRVYSIGSTVIFYRDPSLPRLQSTLAIEPKVPKEEGYAGGGADAAEGGEGGEGEEGQGSAQGGRNGRRRPTQYVHQSRPSEFTRL